MPVAFYPCRVNGELNGRPWTPEVWTGRAMLNPFYAQKLKTGGRLTTLWPGLYVQDSQAFQTLLCRMLYEQALAEGLDFARDYFPHQMDRSFRGEPLTVNRLRRATVSFR